jgi:hypothetical protein
VAAGATVAADVTVIIASIEDTGQMLLEADAGFSRNSGGIGVDSPEKILDFLLNLPLDDTHVRIARWGCFPRLDLVSLDLVLLDLV